MELLDRTLPPQAARKCLIDDRIPEKTIEKFLINFHDHPAVWKSFERFTLEAISANKKLGAKAIMERVRWEAEVEQGNDFKVNNNYTAYYARVFSAKYPEFGNYFEFREAKGLQI